MSFKMTEVEKRDQRALVLWVVEQAEHSDNIGEMIHVVLAHLWESVGLPGKLPCDEHGFVDLAALERVRLGLRRWPDIDAIAPNVTEYMARLYSFERREDVGKVKEAAIAAGFETYEYRRDLVVVDPDGGRR